VALGVARGLVHEIIRRWEQRGFTLVAIKVIQPDEALCKARAACLRRSGLTAAHRSH
jgi:nucleoside diphosphate kinase